MKYLIRNRYRWWWYNYSVSGKNNGGYMAFHEHQPLDYADRRTNTAKALRTHRHDLGMAITCPGRKWIRHTPEVFVLYFMEAV